VEEVAVVAIGVAVDRLTKRCGGLVEGVLVVGMQQHGVSSSGEQPGLARRGKVEHVGHEPGAIEFDPELRVFTGHVIDLRDEIYFEGDSVESLEASMRRAVDHYLAVCQERGEEPARPFSGKLNVRLGPELHRAAATAAASEGESLNNWLIRVVDTATRDVGSKTSTRKVRQPVMMPRQKKPMRQQNKLK
jgi:predicted HicB family RNase H-like nuclease